MRFPMRRVFRAINRARRAAQGAVNADIAPSRVRQTSTTPRELRNAQKPR